MISPVQITYTDPVDHKREIPADSSTVFAQARLVMPLGDTQFVVAPYRGSIDLTQLFDR